MRGGEGAREGLVAPRRVVHRHTHTHTHTHAHTASDMNSKDMAQLKQDVDEAAVKNGKQRGAVAVVPVAFSDVHRDVGSFFGANISDDRVVRTSPGSTPTVLPAIAGNNFEDKGHVSDLNSKHVQIVISDPDGQNPRLELLGNVLKRLGELHPHCGVDRSLSFDFPTVTYRAHVNLLQVNRGEPVDLHCTTRSYSADAGDAQNLILFCTSQGTSLFLDGPGETSLYTQAVVDGELRNFHLWVQPDLHDQGVEDAGMQTQKQKQQVAALGEATQQPLGPLGVPATAGALIIKIPLQKQKAAPLQYLGSGTVGGPSNQYLVYRSLGAAADGPPCKGTSKITMASVSRGRDAGPAQKFDQSVFEPALEQRPTVTQMLWTTVPLQSLPSVDQLCQVLKLRDSCIKIAHGDPDATIHDNNREKKQKVKKAPLVTQVPM